MSDIAEGRPEAVPEPEHPGAEEATTVATWLRRGLIAVAVVYLASRLSGSALVVIGALIFFIFMHELGHYLTARWAGMKVTQFFIGFGPTLWSFRRGETEYGVKPIPAGAFVRIIGMTNLEEVDPADEARTYRQKPYWRRLSVAVAGSTMHFLMAIVLMFGVVSLIGLPDPTAEDWTIGTISRLEETGTSPALEADLELGDRIVAVDGQRFADFPSMAEYLQERPGETVTLRVERDGERFTTSTRLADRNPDGEPRGFLGVSATYPTTRMGPVEGAVEAVRATGEAMVLSVQGLGQFFSPSGLSGYVDTLSGATPSAEAGEGEGETRLLSPVGVVRVAEEAGAAGTANLVYLLFVINVFIGVFNLVPLLPFDGGHVAIATYERLRSIGGRRHFADVTRLMPLTYAVIGVLVLLTIGNLYLDIWRPPTLS